METGGGGRKRIELVRDGRRKAKGLLHHHFKRGIRKRGNRISKIRMGLERLGKNERGQKGGKRKQIKQWGGGREVAKDWEEGGEREGKGRGGLSSC